MLVDIVNALIQSASCNVNLWEYASRRLGMQMTKLSHLNRKPIVSVVTPVETKTNVSTLVHSLASYSNQHSTVFSHSSLPNDDDRLISSPQISVVDKSNNSSIQPIRNRRRSLRLRLNRTSKIESLESEPIKLDNNCERTDVMESNKSISVSLAPVINQMTNSRLDIFEDLDIFDDSLEKNELVPDHVPLSPDMFSSFGCLDDSEWWKHPYHDCNHPSRVRSSTPIRTNQTECSPTTGEQSVHPMFGGFKTIEKFALTRAQPITKQTKLIDKTNRQIMTNLIAKSKRTKCLAKIRISKSIPNPNIKKNSTSYLDEKVQSQSMGYLTQALDNPAGLFEGKTMIQLKQIFADWIVNESEPKKDDVQILADYLAKLVPTNIERVRNCLISLERLIIRLASLQNPQWRLAYEAIQYAVNHSVKRYYNSSTLVLRLNPAI